MDGASLQAECFECDVFRTITNSAYYSILTFPVLIDGFGRGLHRGLVKKENVALSLRVD